MSIHIPKTDEELLSQCEMETFRSSGPGGQNVNKRETAVRLRHEPTGLVVSCQEERSQYRNRQLALEKLREKLKRKNRRKKKRIPTKMPRNVREKIRNSKKRRSRKKDLRKNPPIPKDY